MLDDTAASHIRFVRKCSGTSCSLIRRIDRDELLAAMVKSYLD